MAATNPPEQSFNVFAHSGAGCGFVFFFFVKISAFVLGVGIFGMQYIAGITAKEPF